MPLRSRGEVIREIEVATVHRKFDIPQGSRYYDIAVLKFREVTYSQTVRRICMIENTINTYLRSAVVPGWGTDEKDGPPKEVLHQVDLTIFDTQ